MVPSSLPAVRLDAFMPLAQGQDAKPLYDAYDDDVKIYPVSNEWGLDRAHWLLKTFPIVGNALVTLSGIEGLHQFVSRPVGVGYLINIDANPLQKKFWDILISSIKECATRAQVVEKILERYEERFGSGSDFEKLERYFKNCSHVFYYEKDWLKIKLAVEEGRVISISVNLCYDEAIKTFCQAFQLSGLTVDTLYLSNLHASKWLGIDRTLQIANKIRAMNPLDKINIIYARNPHCACKRSLVQNVVCFTGPIDDFPRTACPKDYNHQIDCINHCSKTLLMWYEGSVRCGRELSKIIGGKEFKDTMDQVAEMEFIDKDLFGIFVKLIDALRHAAVVRNLRLQTRHMESVLPNLMAKRHVSRIARHEPSPFCWAVVYVTDVVTSIIKEQSRLSLN